MIFQERLQYQIKKNMSQTEEPEIIAFIEH